MVLVRAYRGIDATLGRYWQPAWRQAKSVHRVGGIGRPRYPQSVNRVIQVGRPKSPRGSGAFSSDQPNSPTMSEQPSGHPFPSLRRISSNSPPCSPRIPRGLGDRPQKAVRSTYRHRQADRTSRHLSIDRPPHTRYNDSIPPDISTRPKSIERPVPCRYIDIRHRQVANSFVDNERITDSPNIIGRILWRRLSSLGK